MANKSEIENDMLFKDAEHVFYTALLLFQLLVFKMISIIK